MAAYAFDKPIEKAFNLGQNDTKYGQIKFNVRYRYEMIDIKHNSRKVAHANTLHMRLGYLTPKFEGLQGFIQYEGNLSMQKDYFSPKSSWKGDFSHEVVADPEASELNQAWISYKGLSGTELKAGRQRINIDNQRFIGAVGWRQMEQTFDSVLITNQSIENLTFKVGYIGQALTIWSKKDQIQLPFANIQYKYKNISRITAYGLWLADFNAGQAGKSAQTYGLAIAGSPKITKDIKLHYRAEYSYQENYKNNPYHFHLHRYHLMLGASAIGITIKTSIEELGAKNGQAFQTPLGTNHAFQGWADKFLTTPKDGVRDINTTLSSKILGTKLAFVYHNFHSVTKNISYGNEYDFLITKKFGRHYSLLAKYAFYDANPSNGYGSLNKDTHKFWLLAGISF